MFKLFLFMFWMIVLFIYVVKMYDKMLVLVILVDFFDDFYYFLLFFKIIDFYGLIEICIGIYIFLL